MSKELEQLSLYTRSAWHQRWLVLSIATVICIFGWTYVFSIPNKYEVSAKVYLETKSMLRPLLRGLAVESNVTEETAQVLRRTLLSRPFLEKVAKNTGMDSDASTAQEFDKILKNLSEKLTINQDRRQNIYTITYQNKNAKRASNVVEELLNLFVEEALGASRRDTGMTQRFLNEQISEYEAKLEVSEEALKEFKRRNAGLIPGEDRDFFGELARANERLRVATLELREVQNRQDELQNQITEVSRTTLNADPVFVDGKPSNPIDVRIQNVERRLDELVMRYTDDHPDVVSTRRILTELKRQKKEQIQSAVGQQKEMGQLVENPIYRDLKVEIGRVKAKRAALQVRVAQHRDRVAYLKRMIDTIPQVEADLAKLNRDYRVMRENYEELVKRRESAKLSFEAEKSDDVQFQVIDPPRTPLVPISPNRPLLLTGVLFAGIGAGIGLIVLMQQHRPTFFSGTSLKEATGLPVFGSVSLFLTQPQVEKERHQVMLFGMAFIGLVVIYIGLMIVQKQYISLGALV